MTTVHDLLPQIKPSWRSIDLVGRTETLDDDEVPIVCGPGRPVPVAPAVDDVEPFMAPEDCAYRPTPAEEAWWSAFTLAKAGESPRASGRPPVEIALAFANGAYAARRAMELDDAFDLGRRRGLASETPGDPPREFEYDAAWIGSFARGFAAGRSEFEDDRAFEAWVEIHEADRLEDAFRPDLATTDADAWPNGSWT